MPNRRRRGGGGAEADGWQTVGSKGTSQSDKHATLGSSSSPTAASSAAPLTPLSYSSSSSSPSPSPTTASEPADLASASAPKARTTNFHPSQPTISTTGSTPDSSTAALQPATLRTLSAASMSSSSEGGMYELQPASSHSSNDVTQQHSSTQRSQSSRAAPLSDADPGRSPATDSQLRRPRKSRTLSAQQHQQPPHRHDHSPQLLLQSQLDSSSQQPPLKLSALSPRSDPQQSSTRPPLIAGVGALPHTTPTQPTGGLTAGGSVGASSGSGIRRPPVPTKRTDLSWWQSTIDWLRCEWDLVAGSVLALSFLVSVPISYFFGAVWISLLVVVLHVVLTYWQEMRHFSLWLNTYRLISWNDVALSLLLLLLPLAYCVFIVLLPDSSIRRALSWSWMSGSVRTAAPSSSSSEAVLNTVSVATVRSALRHLLSAETLHSLWHSVRSVLSAEWWLQLARRFSELNARALLQQMLGMIEPTVYMHPALNIVCVCVIVFVLPMLIELEEQVFRRGTRTVFSAIARSMLYGALHLLAGAPLGACLLFFPTLGLLLTLIYWRQMRSLLQRFKIEESVALVLALRQVIVVHLCYVLLVLVIYNVYVLARLVAVHVL